MRKLCRAALALLLWTPALAWAQQAAPQDPTLTHRPPPVPVTPEQRRIQLDVVVTDDKGRPVSGLTQQDFALFDNKLPRPIVAFHAFDGTAQKPAPPVQVILVLDKVNLNLNEVAFARQSMERFFAQNDSHLAIPVSIFVFDEDGVRAQPQPSMDGKVLAATLGQVGNQLRTIGRATAEVGAIERFNMSVRAITQIAEAKKNVPGRKLLIWIGPGWGQGGLDLDSPSGREERWEFDSIVHLSTALRQGRISLYCISNEELSAYTNFYQSYLKGVVSPEKARLPNLNLKVLAIQNGGRVTVPGNDLAGQMNTCIQDASAFYTLTFDPPRADHSDEYHDLKVEIARPKLTARTSTGYYNQP